MDHELALAVKTGSKANTDRRMASPAVPR